MSSTADLLSSFGSTMVGPLLQIASSEPMRDQRVKEHVEALLLGSSHGLNPLQPQHGRLNGSGAVCRRTRPRAICAGVVCLFCLGISRFHGSTPSTFSGPKKDSFRATFWLCHWFPVI